jgi:NTP-dependent ternary system trypsin peptidase co-occuring protein
MTVSHIVEMPLESGEKILVEVEPVPGVGRASRGDHAVEVAKHTLEKGLDQLGPLMNAVVRQLRGIDDPPEKVTLQFGLKVSGELGLIIGKTAAEANFTISAEWTAQPSAGNGLA